MSCCGSNKTISLLKEEKVRVNGLLAAGLVGGVAPSRTSLALPKQLLKLAPTAPVADKVAALLAPPAP